MAALHTPPCSPASDTPSCFVSPASSLSLSYSEPILDHQEESPQTLRNVSRRLSFSSISAKRSPKRSPRLSPTLSLMRTTLSPSPASTATFATSNTNTNTLSSNAGHYTSNNNNITTITATTLLSCDGALQSPAFALISSPSPSPSPSLSSSRRSPHRKKNSRLPSHRCCDSVDSDFVSFKYDYDENISDYDSEPNSRRLSMRSEASLSAFPYSAALDESVHNSPVSNKQVSQNIQRRPLPLKLGHQSNYANKAFAEHSSKSAAPVFDSKQGYARLQDVGAREPSIDSSSFRTSSDYDSTLESTGPLTPTKPFSVFTPISTIDETIHFANSMYHNESPLPQDSLWPDQFNTNAKSPPTHPSIHQPHQQHFHVDHSLSSNWKEHMSASITSTATTATCKSFTTVPELPCDDHHPIERPKKYTQSLTTDDEDSVDFDTDTDEISELPSDCSLSIFPVPPTTKSEFVHHRPTTDNNINNSNKIATNDSVATSVPVPVSVLSPMRTKDVNNLTSPSVIERTPRISPNRSRFMHRKSAESSSKSSTISKDSSERSSLDSSTSSFRKSLTTRLSITPKSKSSSTKKRPASILNDFQQELLSPLPPPQPSQSSSVGSTRSPKPKSFLKELTLSKRSSFRTVSKEASAVPASTAARPRIRSFSDISNRNETGGARPKLELKRSCQSLLRDGSTSANTPDKHGSTYLTDPWSDLNSSGGSNRGSPQLESTSTLPGSTRSSKLFYSGKGGDGPLGKVIGETSSIKSRSSLSCDTKTASTCSSSSTRLSPSPRLSTMLRPCSLSPIKSNFPPGATTTFIATRPAPVRLSSSYPSPWYPLRARSNSNLQSPTTMTTTEAQSRESPTPNPRTYKGSPDAVDDALLYRGSSIDSAEHGGGTAQLLMPDPARKLSQSTPCMPSSVKSGRTAIRGNSEWVEYGYAL